MPRFAGLPPWGGMFRGYGRRITVPRQKILSVLNSTDKHLTAEEIYFKVYQEYPTIGLTTVYRTLELLAKMGVINKFDIGDGKARFELAGDDKKEKHHHHLICNSCHRIIDYHEFADEEKDLIEKTEKALSKTYDFKIHGHLINFYGLCKYCAMKV
ncbi:MAG: transcriptional repressor [Candidatus Hydrogenedentota bacterium]